ncbi:unnamed protein product [Brassicogethes aeneus]|uniref:Transforming acidic coiled-coil-containing protein C-terminal domain-containing protein n=1 Tax=Brassicogethes aeneus TaxID=1431903 RepID=A0A9P0FN61_BRAAE|nr:unnamed protein product [Brassicogethes aeneus]
MEARSPLKEINRHNLNETTNTMKPMESVKDDRTINVNLIKTDQENGASGANANKNQQLDSLTNPLKIDIGNETNLSLVEDGLLSDSDDFQSISPINKEDELLLNTPLRKLPSAVTEGVYLSPAAIIRVNSFNHKNNPTNLGLELEHIEKKLDRDSVQEIDNKLIIIPKTPLGKLGSASDDIYYTPSAKSSEGYDLNSTVVKETGKPENVSSDVFFTPVAVKATEILDKTFEVQESTENIENFSTTPTNNQADSGLELSHSEEPNLNKTANKLESFYVNEKPEKSVLNITHEKLFIEEAKSLLNVTQEYIPPITLESATDNKEEAKHNILEHLEVKEEPKSEKSVLNTSQEKISTSPITLSTASEDKSEESNFSQTLPKEEPKLENLNQTFEAVKKDLHTTPEKIECTLAINSVLNITQEKISASEDTSESHKTDQTEEANLNKTSTLLQSEVNEEPIFEKNASNTKQEKISVSTTTIESAALEDTSGEANFSQNLSKVDLNQTFEAVKEKIPLSTTTIGSAASEDKSGEANLIQTLSKEEPKLVNNTSEKVDLNQTFEAVKITSNITQEKIPVSTTTIESAASEDTSGEANFSKTLSKEEPKVDLNQTFEAVKITSNITQEKIPVSTTTIESAASEDTSGEANFSQTLSKEEPKVDLNQTFEEVKIASNITQEKIPVSTTTIESAASEDTSGEANFSKTLSKEKPKLVNNTSERVNLNQTFEAVKKDLHTSVINSIVSPPLPGNKIYSAIPKTEDINKVDPKEPKSEDIEIENLNRTFEAEKVLKPDSKEVTPTVTDSLEFKNSEKILTQDTADSCKHHQLEVKDLKDKKEEDVTLPAVNLVDSKIQKMAELTTEQQREIADLKFQLQQARASLELEIRQKEEIVIKTQAERNDFKSEIKELNEMLKEKSKILENNLENGGSKDKELEEQVKEGKEKAAQMAHELKKREAQHMKLMEEYENNFSTKVSEQDKLLEVHQTAKMHLANLEFSFSDVHKKYERLKVVLEGYKSNETSLKLTVAMAQNNLKKADERYESLKHYAKAQIDKSNKEIQLQKKHYEDKQVQISAINKRLEIKCKSLESSLEQKTSECQQLAALCDQLTGKNM